MTVAPASDRLSQVSVNPWLYRLLLPIHRLFMHLYFRRIEIEGKENLPLHGPVVLAPKHTSRWDPIVLALLSREPLWFMTNANQFGGIQGWFIRRLGSFPIDLSHPSISSLRCAIALLQAGRKLVLFPEGGIVRNQTLRQLKPGVARLVLQAEKSATDPLSVPIIPIWLDYKPAPVFGASIRIYIHPPLQLEEHRRETDKETAKALTQALQTALLEDGRLGDEC